MHRLDYAEFYTTHVCNLNCTNCNRFNNFNFKGHKFWKDHESDYCQWAKLIVFKEIGILGGEPLLNPDFPNWFLGVCKLWPESTVRVITNGSLVTKVKNLYQLLTSVSNKVILEINCHNLDYKYRYEQQIESLLGANCKKTFINTDRNHLYWQKTYNAIKDPSWPDCDFPSEFINLPAYIQKECITNFNFSPEIHKLKFELTNFTNNKLHVNLCTATSFNNSTVIYDQPTNTLSLNKSDPAKAMEVCYFKKCHHFINGKLYKCGPVGILPEFVKQFDVKRDEYQEKLIHNYKPASHSWSTSELDDFVHNLKNAIPIEQCSLCPEKLINTDFVATTDKIKIVRID